MDVDCFSLGDQKGSAVRVPRPRDNSSTNLPDTSAGKNMTAELKTK